MQSIMLYMKQGYPHNSFSDSYIFFCKTFAYKKFMFFFTFKFEMPHIHNKKYEVSIRTNIYMIKKQDLTIEMERILEHEPIDSVAFHTCLNNHIHYYDIQTMRYREKFGTFCLAMNSDNKEIIDKIIANIRESIYNLNDYDIRDYFYHGVDFFIKNLPIFLKEYKPNVRRFYVQQCGI